MADVIERKRKVLTTKEGESYDGNISTGNFFVSDYSASDGCFREQKFR